MPMFDTAVPAPDVHECMCEVSCSTGRLLGGNYGGELRYA